MSETFTLLRDGAKPWRIQNAASEGEAFAVFEESWDNMGGIAQYERATEAMNWLEENEYPHEYDCSDTVEQRVMRRVCMPALGDSQAVTFYEITRTIEITTTSELAAVAFKLRFGGAA